MPSIEIQYEIEAYKFLYKTKETPQNSLNKNNVSL